MLGAYVGVRAAWTAVRARRPCCIPILVWTRLDSEVVRMRLASVLTTYPLLCT